MTKPAFYLTRQAARQLQDIYIRSEAQWGEARAERYMDELYASMKSASERPMIGMPRKARSTPFLMIPAGQHFVVYDSFKMGIVVLALIHQRCNIETLIANMEPSFFAEIDKIKRKLKN